jgi:hypothetical protein
MARFGIEGIRYFDRAIDEGHIVVSEPELPYVFNICNGLDKGLRDAGHSRAFYWANDLCWEIDIKSVTKGGSDEIWADNVDLFFIITHSGYWNHATHLVYNVAIQHFETNSTDWELGTRQLEWLCIFGCFTHDLAAPLDHLHLFQRLHQFCGSYDNLSSGWTVTEAGEDFADELTDGEPVSRAWLSALSDWWLDNHPISLAVERRETWNNGNPNWSNTTLNRDHLWGHGTTVPDIFPTDIYWMSWIHAEG